MRRSVQRRLILGVNFLFLDRAAAGAVALALLGTLILTPCAAVAKSDKAAKSDASAEAASPNAPNPIYGEPLAPGMVKLLQEEIVSALQTRGNEGDFARFQSYAGGRLAMSAGGYTGSELTGNCRLSWYEHLLRNPLQAPAEAEEFTRLLHKAIVDDPSGLGPAWPPPPEKLDLGKRKPRAFVRGAFAAAGLGSRQAVARRGADGLCRRPGAAEQERSPRVGRPISIRCWWARTTWAIRSTIAAPAAACAT